ncbi:EF-hand domain-containing protein [Kitasatospora cathayae]|uniref:EF-hand domain-containing protein n=1 Tax=Kitasatospora cathayae TaxID=3004092 RepID=A0ABY7Q5G7_9ACTN|nr:EF-hand domain-containing protein [Kitasatospora sp. HUAS 3-15]WBP87772.1 EF-hand domain-containing protein [Kitasatospora sp. HUAS 3-15]
MPDPGVSFKRDLSEWRVALVAWRLLVLQAADPVVGAGMTEHSTYRAHPWRRIEHTLGSGRRLFYQDADALRREVARLNRSHKRIRGTMPDGQPYDARDAATRVWVLLTLFECVVAMRRLGGDPYDSAQLELAYREFKEAIAAFDLPGAELPKTAADLPAYFARYTREKLEFTESTRYLLDDMLREAPRPRRLWFLGDAGWRITRLLVARVIRELTVADLPPAVRQRLGLARTRRGALLSAVLHRGAGAVVPLLPDRVRYRSPEEEQPPRRLRLQHGDARGSRVDRFFREVLDQTGDGFITVHDLRAMAHNVCWQLELDEDAEARLYRAFDGWWEQLRAAMDANGDGKVSREEFTAATLAGLDQDEAYLEQGLLPALRAVFVAADTDGSGFLEFDEYRAVFGGPRVHPAELSHGFRQLDTDGDGRITLEEFLRGFTEFFTARADSTSGAQLLGRP